ncbi:MAG TPA: hypothetical protein VGJ62_05790 [Gemmatimonadaceae bacterium]|jgi:hypothetical protein
MERSESGGFNENTGGEQAGFGSSGIGQSSTVGSDSNKSFAEPESGGITGRVKSVGSSIKDKASEIPSIIADGLEAGAKALRQKRPVGDTSTGASVALTSDSSVTAVTDTLASGLQSSADWLRDADMEKIKSGVETQVKEHPARSLLIALGAGYLIGKAFRR